jgi:hypothetical protein
MQLGMMLHQSPRALRLPTKQLIARPYKNTKKTFIEENLKFQKRPLKTIHNVDNSDLVANCGNPELTS